MHIIIIASNLWNELANQTKLIFSYCSYICCIKSILFQLYSWKTYVFYIYIIDIACSMHLSFNEEFNFIIHK